MILGVWIYFYGFLGRCKPAYCAKWEIAGGGSVAVAVGFSDKWRVTHDTWNVTNDIGHVTHDIRHVTNYFCVFFFLLQFLSVLVLVLLPAHVERFNVFLLRNFSLKLFKIVFSGVLNHQALFHNSQVSYGETPQTSKVFKTVDILDFCLA